MFGKHRKNKQSANPEVDASQDESFRSAQRAANTLLLLIGDRRYTDKFKRIGYITRYNDATDSARLEIHRYGEVTSAVEVSKSDGNWRVELSDIRTENHEGQTRRVEDVAIYPLVEGQPVQHSTVYRTQSPEGDSESHEVHEVQFGDRMDAAQAVVMGSTLEGIIRLIQSPGIGNTALGGAVDEPPSVL